MMMLRDFEDLDFRSGEKRLLNTDGFHVLARILKRQIESASRNGGLQNGAQTLSLDSGFIRTLDLFALLTAEADFRPDRTFVSRSKLMGIVLADWLQPDLTLLWLLQQRSLANMETYFEVNKGRNSVVESLADKLILLGNQVNEAQSDKFREETATLHNNLNPVTIYRDTLLAIANIAFKEGTSYQQDAMDVLNKILTTSLQKLYKSEADQNDTFKGNRLHFGTTSDE